MRNLGFEDLVPDDRVHGSLLLYRKPENQKSISVGEPPIARSEMRREEIEVEVAAKALFGIMAKGAWAGLNGREVRVLWIKIRQAWNRQAPESKRSQIAFPPESVTIRNDRRRRPSFRVKQAVFLSPTDQWITAQAEAAPVFASAA